MNNNGVIHNLDEQTSSEGFKMSSVIGIIIVTILLGAATGFGVHKIKSSSNSTGTSKTDTTGAKQVGVADKKTFKDNAEGLLKEGGIEGEGSFHLERPGGESQNVYLTSTTVDLSQFVGKKVKVWGQTFSGEKAGWLMDVGLVEVQ